MKYSACIETELCQRMLFTGCGELIGGEESKELGLPVVLPPHFFGELTKSAYGCAVLKKSTYFTYWCAELRQVKSSKRIVVSSKLVKSIIWALAHIGMNDEGLLMILEANIIPEIISLAKNSTILSVKG